MELLTIGSVDTLCATPVEQLIPADWNEQPPLLQGSRKGMGETPILLKGMLRKGVPPALRCAMWLSNVVQATHPHQDASYWHEYRTLAKVRPLDYAYESVLIQILGDESVASMPQKHAMWKSLQAPTYGQLTTPELPQPVTPSGELALRRVLMALERVVGIDYAPLLPTLLRIFLTVMSESYAFCAIREMAHQSDFFFPVSRRECKAWEYAFQDVLRKLHKTTFTYLEGCGVMDDLSPIFGRFFVGILPFPFVLRIMDIYTLEGAKVLYRFGVALLVLYKMDSMEHLITISKAQDWWAGLRAWSHSNRFNFDKVVRKAYGVHGKGVRRQMRFPRRQILHRIIKIEEDRLLEEGDETEFSEAPARPLGVIHPSTNVLSEEEPAKPILAEPLATRMRLAEWLPITLRMTNLELLYSTNHHGRSLEMFYSRVKNARHTVLLCEAYPDVGMGVSSPTILGLYASQAWRVSNQVYGDGGCFLFRLEPKADCWKWKPRPTKGSVNLIDSNELVEEDFSESNETALLEQFMVGTHTYISMGGNQDGSAGLRLNEDFTKGESSPAAGFENEPLHGLNAGSVFEVGLVEVYGLVRQIDGRAV